MLNKLLIFMIVLISTVGLGSAVSISGTVSESGIGLSDVDINIGTSSTATNATGYYIVSGLTENTTYTVIASKDLYNTNSIDITVTQSDVTNADISLSKTSLSGFMNKITECVTSVTTMFKSIMSVFMQPPLVVFVGLGIFGFVIAIVARYMAGRRG